MGGGGVIRGFGRELQLVLFLLSIYATSSPKNHIDSQFYSKEHQDNMGTAKYQSYNYLMNFEVLGSPLDNRPTASARGSEQPVGPRQRGRGKKEGEHTDDARHST